MIMHKGRQQNRDLYGFKHTKEVLCTVKKIDVNIFNEIIYLHVDETRPIADKKIFSICHLDLKDGNKVSFKIKHIFQMDFRIWLHPAVDFIDILIKFCHWRDVQISSCLGGFWDASPQNKVFYEQSITHESRMKELKTIVQTMDYDYNKRAFMPRHVALLDLSDVEKSKLRKRN